MTAGQDVGAGLGAGRVLEEWGAELDAALRGGDFAAAARLFRADGYWRDLLALTWDYRTFAGPAEIERALADSAREVDPSDFRPAPDRMPARLIRRSGRTLV